MLGDLSRAEKIYIRTGYTDMRKQLDGLIDIIQYSFRLDPYTAASGTANSRSGILSTSRGEAGNIRKHF